MERSGDGRRGFDAAGAGCRGHTSTWSSGVKDIKDSVQRQFGDVAGNYAISRVFAAGADLERLRAEAAEIGPDRALDVGTAAGHVALALAEHSRVVIGLDLTHSMLDRASELARERQVENLRFLRGDVEHLPLADRVVDLVTCRFSGHHFPNPKAFVAEAARVLRGDGTILLADTVSPPDRELDAFINRIEVLRDPSHVRDYAVAGWIGFFADVGLRAELLLDWRLTLDFDDWVARMRTPANAVAELRRLLGDATPSVRSAFEIELANDRSWLFKQHCAVIRARRA